MSEKTQFQKETEQVVGPEFELAWDEKKAPEAAPKPEEAKPKSKK